MLKEIFKNKNIRLELTKKLTKLDHDINVNDVRGIKIMTLISTLSFPLAALGTFMLFSTYTETQIVSIFHFMFVMFSMICSFSLIFMSSAFSIFGLLNYFGFKRKNKDMSIYFKKIMNNSELSIFNNDYNSLRNEINKFIQKLNKEELTCIYQTEEKYLNLNKICMEELSSFIKDENNKETVKNEVYYLETILKNKKKYTEELCEKYPDDETWQDIAKEELKEMDLLFLYLDKLKENNVINIKKRVLKKIV